MFTSEVITGKYLSDTELSLTVYQHRKRYYLGYTGQFLNSFSIFTTTKYIY